MESCETCRADCAPEWRAKVKGGCVYHRPKDAIDGYVPVVYCKECYWWNGKKCDRGVSLGNGQYFYCALGQRRSHEESP